MDMKLIKTQADYEKALKRLEEIFDAPIGSVESDEADVLALLIDEYEKKHYPVEAPDPIEAIKIRMKEMQLKQTASPLSRRLSTPWALLLPVANGPGDGQAESGDEKQEKPEGEGLEPTLVEGVP